MKYIKDELITHRRGVALEKPVSKWKCEQYRTNPKYNTAVKQIDKLQGALLRAGQIDYSQLDKKTLFNLFEYVNLLRQLIYKAEANAPELIYDIDTAIEPKLLKAVKNPYATNTCIPQCIQSRTLINKT
tara:strand:- start:3890 stop:4276 length:387 start_codon:yes stop_codon:yes gene_type:complete